MAEFRLADYRRKKGLTQEQLAELSGVSSRTIQRIEKGTVVPHFETLRILADCLDTQAELLMNMSEPSAVVEEQPVNANLLPLFHLLGLLGLLFPGLNIILPLIFWIFKKDENLDYDQHGKQVINFHLSLTLIFFLSIPLMVYLFEIGFALLIIIYLFILVSSIVNLYRSINSIPVKYPFSFPFLRIQPTTPMRIL